MSATGGNEKLLKGYADVVFAVGSNYPLIIYTVPSRFRIRENDEVCQLLFRLLIAVCGRMNRDVLNNSFEVWENISDAIKVR